MKGSRPLAKSDHYDIAVVGAGPVGLTAALALAQHDLKVVLLEAGDGPCSGSRAINISRRSQQILAAVGIKQPLLARGLAFHQARSYLGKKEIFHLHMPSQDSDRFPPFLNLQQFLLEEMLLDEVAKHPQLDLVCHAEARLTTHDERGVTLDWQSADGPRTITADWCVAADGARSGLRRHLDLQLKGDAYEKTYLIADIRMQTDLPVERRVWFDPATNPGSTVILHRQPDDILRIDYQLGPDEDPQAELEEARVLARLQAHLDYIGYGEKPWELVWKSLYNARALSLDSYHHGRILFAGDAAHLVPIFGVRGMNSGIDDAFNLAWKLARVAKKQADPALLDSYTEERRGAFVENIAAARLSTFFMSPPGPGTALMRDAALELACSEPQFRPLINPRQSSAHCYRSPLIQQAETQPDWPEGTQPGWPLPDLPWPEGGTLNDRLGPHLTLICFGTDSQIPAGLPEETQLITLPADSAAGRLCGAVAGDWLLLRPDHHIMARGQIAHTNPVTAIGAFLTLVTDQPEARAS